MIFFHNFFNFFFRHFRYNIIWGLRFEPEVQVHPLPKLKPTKRFRFGYSAEPNSQTLGLRSGSTSLWLLEDELRMRMTSEFEIATDNDIIDNCGTRLMDSRLDPHSFTSPLVSLSSYPMVTWGHCICQQPCPYIRKIRELRMALIAFITL